MTEIVQLFYAASSYGPFGPGPRALHPNKRKKEEVRRENKEKKRKREGTKGEKRKGRQNKLFLGQTT